MPASYNDDNGELDVMEMIGSEPTSVDMTIHGNSREQGHRFTVGGNWPGNPDATTRFPASMEVDYVRIYQ
jgi:hypothetical protein